VEVNASSYCPLEGGGYIFVHRLLLEYFAGLDDAAQ